MTSKQRAYLKGLASDLETIFQIGKGGVTDEICHQLYNALEARELIKIKNLETCPTSVKETAELIAKGTGAEVVQTIGMKIVLFKASTIEKNRKIDLSKIR
ncbi:MAG: ribosome assembly RNA-binding protein YhbY [Clostridia bacterium]|nr:ribosome assembly RNA-binding protein YhbY [Clostridia bacterium]